MRTVVRVLSSIVVVGVVGMNLHAEQKVLRTIVNPFTSETLRVYEALPENDPLVEKLKSIKLPPGFKIELYARVPNARSIAIGLPMGTVYVGTRLSEVYAVIDRNRDMKGDEVIEIANTLNMPNGIAFKDGWLYVAENHRIIKYPAPEFDFYRQFPYAVVYDKLPPKYAHGWRYIRFGPDGKLYVAIGSPCNVCEPQGIEGTIARMDPDGSNFEIVARGVRNSVGFDWNPTNKLLYFGDNQVDGYGPDEPPEELNIVRKIGQHYGFPYLHGKNYRDPTYGKGKDLSKYVKPAWEFQAHVATVGMSFYRGKMFPKKYQGQLFVCQHGSWDRPVPVGYRVVLVKFDKNGNPVKQETFAEGWLDPKTQLAWGRPVDVKELPDGSLLISDDFAGALYRVYYSGE